MPVHRVAGGWRWGKSGKVYKSRAGAERQARAIYASGWRGDAEARLRRAYARTDAADPRRRPGLPIYPPGHKVGTEVPEGGSSCANCRHYKEGGTCDSPAFQEWNGSDIIPLPDEDPTRYCSDLWEPRK